MLKGQGFCGTIESDGDKSHYLIKKMAAPFDGLTKEKPMGEVLR